ncbi:MAG: alpha/beta hydrolase [Bacteroidales bacterium]|nr:alpha/beta hydrolase [Bacteroidales bacterium]
MPEVHHKTEFGGRYMHYRDEGRKNTKTIVLLHGLLQNLTVWDELTLKLFREYRVISIDLPGHGYSDLYNSDAHTMEFMARCVNEVLINCGVNDCVIIGHSLGGYVALSYAELFEKNIKGIGLVHALAIADSPEKKESRQKVCEMVKTNRPTYIIQFIPSLFAPCNRMSMAKRIEEMKDQALKMDATSIIAAQMGMIRRKTSIPFLDRTNRPVMFIYGKQDDRIPIEMAAIQATVPQHAEMLMLDNVGHMAHIECPDLVAKWIRNFVDICYAQ